MRIQLVVAYDGTDFAGWAHNPGRRTVQGTLTEAVRQVSNDKVDIVGASRTDSGAHARGQVCHFDSEVAIPVAKWPRILNRILPPDVAVQMSRKVATDFHSRFSARDRFYRFRILTGKRDPHRSRFAYSYGRPLNVELMQSAADALLGEHDFLAYTEELDPSVENTRRRLMEVKVRAMRDEVWIDVVGTAFLRGMMRRISGALLEVGRGHRPEPQIAELLDPTRRDLIQWPVVLPACGLCLMRIRY